MPALPVSKNGWASAVLVVSAPGWITLLSQNSPRSHRTAATLSAESTATR